MNELSEAGSSGRRSLPRIRMSNSAPGDLLQQLAPILLDKKTRASSSRNARRQSIAMSCRGAICRFLWRALVESAAALASSLRHELFKIRCRHAEPRAHLVDHLAPHQRIADLRDCLGQLSRDLHFRAKRAQIDLCNLTLDPVIEKIARRRRRVSRIPLCLRGGPTNPDLRPAASRLPGRSDRFARSASSECCGRFLPGWSASKQSTTSSTKRFKIRA